MDAPGADGAAVRARPNFGLQNIRGAVVHGRFRLGFGLAAAHRAAVGVVGEGLYAAHRLVACHGNIGDAPACASDADPLARLRPGTVIIRRNGGLVRVHVLGGHAASGTDDGRGIR